MDSNVEGLHDYLSKKTQWISKNGTFSPVFKAPCKKTLDFSFPLKVMLVWTFHMLGKGTKTGCKAFLVLAP